MVSGQAESFFGRLRALCLNMNPLTYWVDIRKTSFRASLLYNTFGRMAHRAI